MTEEGPAIQVIYPSDLSPVCADQVCTFRDMEWLTFIDAQDVVGISADSSHAHKRFIQEYDLQFPLLTDRLGGVADEYGLLIDGFEGHANVPKRAIVSVDGARTVRYTWTAETQYTSPTIERGRPVRRLGRRCDCPRRSDGDAGPPGEHEIDVDRRSTPTDLRSRYSDR